MNLAANQPFTSYELIQEESLRSGTPNRCTARADDVGFWNNWKAWYLCLVHLLACVLTLVAITQIDGLNFKIGSSPNILSFELPLYQAQVTGLVSLALVIIRIIAGSCSALLVWRTIFILLEKRGISLIELTHLTNWRIPILPGLGPKTPVHWSIWATVTIILLWPQSFAAPFASSSLSWIPQTTVVKDSSTASVPRVAKYADWASLLYNDMRANAVMAAAALTSKDPTYAFNSDQIPLRRYFNASESMPLGTEVDLTVPYFAVDLRWIDANATDVAGNAGFFDYSNVASNFGIRAIGATAIIRNATYDDQAAIPSQSSIFRGKKIVALKLRTLNFGDELPDGSRANNKTKCLTVSPDFGRLPDVEQQQVNIVNSIETVAHDCYIFAEATIVAGIYKATRCNVTSPSSDADHYATCYIDRHDRAVEKDWLAPLALDFLSDALQYTVMQNYSQPWISHDITNYTAGMLTLGYHAAWCGLMKRLGNSTETVTFWPSESVVAASVEISRLYIWIGMNATLTLAALLVFVAQKTAKTKTVRDPAVAALTVDLTQVSHSEHASGLCNAVDLSKKDGKLPRLRWKTEGDLIKSGGQTGGASCSRSVVFVHEPGSK